jgi:tetratricopeptide (TPR) repeat protein
MPLRKVVVAKFNLNKKQILIGVGVVLVLGVALGAGALLGWLQAPSITPQTSETKDKLPSSIVAVNALVGQGKVAEAEQKIDESLKAPTTPPSEKYLLYMSKAGIASDKQDLQATLAALLDAEKQQETSELSARIAATYAQLNQNDKAIDYYKKSIRLNPESNPLRERENELSAEMIRDLGGQP